MIPLKDRNPTQRTAYVTMALIALNVAVFLFVQRPLSSDDRDDLEFSYKYAAIPCELTTNESVSISDLTQGCSHDDPSSAEAFPDKNIWLAVLFSMFLHAGWLHLGGNMLFLWVFGNNIEDKLGPVAYLGFYLAGGVLATLGHVAVAPNSTVPVVGASGTIAGVMGAYLVWFPRAKILTLFLFLLFFVGELQAKWILGLWFLLQFLTISNSGVAWAAHVGGFVFGVIVGWLLRDKARDRQAEEWERYRGLGASNLPPPYPHDRRFGGRNWTPF